MIPEINGLELVDLIRAAEKELDIEVSKGVAILLISSFPDKDSIIGKYGGQCCGFLTKPVVRKKLIEKLEEPGLIQEENVDTTNNSS